MDMVVSGNGILCLKSFGFIVSLRQTLCEKLHSFFGHFHPLQQYIHYNRETIPSYSSKQMGDLAEPVVSFVLENIGKLLVKETQFLVGVSEEAEQLQSKLKLLLSLLRDVDSRQQEAAVLREWISQSKDVAYDAENTLESFAFRVASRRGKGLAHFLKRCSCILSECYARHRVGLEIQNLHTRISKVTENFQEYGIKNTVEGESPSSKQQQLMRRTYSHVEGEDFVGLENDVEMLVQHLTNEQEVSPYSVVSIYGMGGLGKSIIARKVYKHPNVRYHFGAYAWFCVSQQWKTKDILQGLLLDIIPENREEILKWTEDELVGHLYRIQQSKRCLIVLDDIWSTDAWECMKHAFPTAERSRSKILLTTRNRDVAIHIEPNGIHHKPRLLSNDESWELLQKKALRGRGLEDIHKFEELGKEMVKRCGGLPLAVVVLGGILATKELNEWKFVCQNIKSLFGKGESIGQRGELEKILALSYNDLPYHLKPCFLYLSIYPEDCDIDTEELYQLWMAEGMVSEEHRNQGESMMDVSERYLGELVKRCMIQVSLKEGPILRKFKCRLHDLMRDMCLAKARDENFLKVVDYRQGNNPELVDTVSSGPKCHRIAIFLNDENISKYVPPPREAIKHVRSMTFRQLEEYSGDRRMASTKFNNFKMLRALTIERMCLCNGHTYCESFRILNQILKLETGKLIHLRYLSLRNSEIMMLPSSLGNLEHLETLDLRGCDILLVIRNVLWKMKNLKHLYFNYEHVFTEICCKLRLLGLTKLEILENFSSTLCEIKDLRNLSNVQVLKALKIRLENDCEEIINFISDLQSLKQASLFLSMSDDFRKSEKWLALLEKLLSSKLCHLYLEGYLGVLPEYKSHFFQNLVELELCGSHLELIGTLEKLPNLESLWLRDDAFVGTEIICSSAGFPQLRFLLLNGLRYLREWRVENGAMANLSCLRIEHCERLKMIPDGLRFMKKLKELAIRGMLPRFCDGIRTINGEEGEDFHKVSHVPSIVVAEIL